MTRTAMLARTSRRASSLLGRPTASALVRRVLPFGMLFFDFDMSAVALDTCEICDDLAEAFSRGPYASSFGAAPLAAPSLAEAALV